MWLLKVKIQIVVAKVVSCKIEHSVLLSYCFVPQNMQIGQPTYIATRLRFWLWYRENSRDGEFPRARVNIQYSWMHLELFMMLFEKV